MTLRTLSTLCEWANTRVVFRFDISMVHHRKIRRRNQLTILLRELKIVNNVGQHSPIRSHSMPLLLLTSAEDFIPDLLLSSDTHSPALETPLESATSYRTPRPQPVRNQVREIILSAEGANAIHVCFLVEADAIILACLPTVYDCHVRAIVIEFFPLSPRFELS